MAIYFHELEPHQWPEFRDAINYLKDRGYRSTAASDFVAAGTAADGGDGIGTDTAPGIARDIPGLQRDHGNGGFMINRSNWRFGDSIQNNIANLEVHGRLFERLTGRSVVG